MATEHQKKQFETKLRNYRKQYLTKKQNLELDESATRIMVNYFLTDVLGYAELVDIKTEYAIKGGYADYVVQLARKKHIVIEVKSIQIDLNEHHLRQSRGYAADEGIDWILLFNGKQIQLYRVIFGKPIDTHQIFNFDITNLSTIRTAANNLINLNKQSVEKGELENYWKRFDALTPNSLIKCMYSADIVNAVRKKVRQTSGINFDTDDIVEALHGLINESHDSVKPKNLK